MVTEATQNSFIIQTTVQKPLPADPPGMKTGPLMHLELSTVSSILAFVSNIFIGKDTPTIYGKDEVVGSIPTVGSKNEVMQRRRRTQISLRSIGIEAPEYILSRVSSEKIFEEPSLQEHFCFYSRSTL